MQIFAISQQHTQSPTHVGFLLSEKVPWELVEHLEFGSVGFELVDRATLVAKAPDGAPPFDQATISGLNSAITIALKKLADIEQARNNMLNGIEARTGLPLS